MATPVLQASSSAQGDAITLVINKPAGTVDGDFLVLAITSSVGRTVSNLTSNGAVWTLLGTELSGDASTAVYTKQASSELTSYTITFNNSGNNYAYLARVDGHASSSPIADWGSANDSGTSLSFTDPVTASADNLLLMIVGHEHTDGNSSLHSSYAVASNNPATWTEEIDLQDTTAGSGGLAVAYGDSTGAGSTGNFSVTATQASEVANGFLIAVQPPADATVTFSTLEVSATFNAPTMRADVLFAPTTFEVAPTVNTVSAATDDQTWANASRPSSSQEEQNSVWSDGNNAVFSDGNNELYRSASDNAWTNQTRP